eukprot:g17280.t1
MFRHRPCPVATRLRIRRGKVPGYLQIKLKAESFVDPLTTVGEFGGAKLFDSGGECISCKSPMMWSLEATPSKKGTVNSNVVPGQNISFPVNENSAYDVMKPGRQVKSWSVSLLLHSTQQKAFVKTELHVPSCLRPDTSNYTVTELSITMKRFAVTVASPSDVTGYKVNQASAEITSFSVHAECEEGYAGTALVSKCSKDGEAYGLSGYQHDHINCDINHCYVHHNDHLNQHGDQHNDFHHDPYRDFHDDQHIHQLHHFHEYFHRDLGEIVSCAPGFTGIATATACSGNQAQTIYSVSGCTPVPDNYICIAPEVTKGYLLTETNLQLNNFQVQVKCAPGYSGNAKVGACSGDKTTSIYKLTGCTSCALVDEE